MLTRGGDTDGLLPLPLPPRPSIADRKWKANMEIAPNCPRCDSSNTKFCYYNNYSLTQPRYFCKNCRRYWTKGGSLRNVPVGGGCRKYRRGRLRISSHSTYGASSLMMPVHDRSRFSSDSSVGNLHPSDANSMASSGGEGTRSDASTIDLAVLYAKFLNHEPQESNPRLARSELPNDFNPSNSGAQSSVVSLEQNSDPRFQFLPEERVGASQVYIGEFDMNHKQEERIIPQFMGLESNGYGLQPLPTEDEVVQDIFWLNVPPSRPPFTTSSFPWQAMNLQGFEPVAEDRLTFNSDPVNANNWSSFDLPEL